MITSLHELINELLKLGFKEDFIRLGYQSYAYKKYDMLFTWTSSNGDVTYTFFKNNMKVKQINIEPYIIFENEFLLLTEMLNVIKKELRKEKINTIDN